MMENLVNLNLLVCVGGEWPHLGLLLCGAEKKPGWAGKRLEKVKGRRISDALCA